MSDVSTRSIMSYRRVFLGMACVLAKWSGGAPYPQFTAAIALSGLACFNALSVAMLAEEIAGMPRIDSAPLLIGVAYAVLVGFHVLAFARRVQWERIVRLTKRTYDRWLALGYAAVSLALFFSLLAFRDL